MNYSSVIIYNAIREHIQEQLMNISKLFSIFCESHILRGISRLFSLFELLSGPFLGRNLMDIPRRMKECTGIISWK